MNRRLIDVFYDVNLKRFYNSSSVVLDSTMYPYINFREKPLVRLRLVTDQALTAYGGFDGSEVYQAVIDYDYSSASMPLCRSTAGDINVVGDWDEADPTAGKFSIRLDANNTRYQTVIGSTGEKAGTQLEFVARNISGDIVFVARFLFRCLNVMDSGTSDVLPTADEYYTVAEIRAQFVAKRADGQGWRMGDDGWPQYFFPNGKWYKQVPMCDPVSGLPSGFDFEEVVE